MIEKLSLDEIVNLFANTPEQSVFDWKRTFEPPRDEVAKGEFVKDVMAVANGTAFSRASGYVVYGVNPDAHDPFLGVTRWDDNEAQALVRSARRHGEGQRSSVVSSSTPSMGPVLRSSRT